MSKNLYRHEIFNTYMSELILDQSPCSCLMEFMCFSLQHLRYVHGITVCLDQELRNPVQLQYLLVFSRTSRILSQHFGYEVHISDDKGTNVF
jgi:hypothetical protein